MEYTTDIAQGAEAHGGQDAHLGVIPERVLRQALRDSRPSGWLQFASGRLSQNESLRNFETIVSLLQSAHGGLSQLHQLLGIATDLVNEAWLNGTREAPPPGDLEREVQMRLSQMEEIVRQCRFHGRGLLDGQSGVVGVAHGLEFIRGGPNTRSSPPEGYAVHVAQAPTRATLQGGVPLDPAWLKDEEEIFIAEGEHFVRYPVSEVDTVETLAGHLNMAVRAAGMDLEVRLTPQRHLVVRHNQHGSQYKFKGASKTTPLLSKRPGKVEWSRRGRDIQGTIGGEPAFGIGRMLIGYLDNQNTSELAVLWRGARNGSGLAGRCHVRQNGLNIQEDTEGEGPATRLALPSFRIAQLGNWMETPSGYGALAGVRFDTWQGLRDALHMMFAVSLELDDWLDKVRGWIKRYQNQTLTFLRHGGKRAARSAGMARPVEVTTDQAERMALELRDFMRKGMVTLR